MPKKASPPSAQVEKLLRQSGIRPKKRLGQHFLIDETILDTIVVAAELSPADIVIEVGPVAVGLEAQVIIFGSGGVRSGV